MPMPDVLYNKLQEELQNLDAEYVQLDGQLIKPSKCYRLETNPPHVLYNTNCPDNLRSKVEAILLKYSPSNESSI